MFRDNYSVASGKASYFYNYLPAPSWGSYDEGFTPNTASFVSMAVYGDTPYVAFKDDSTGKANLYWDNDGMRSYADSDFSDGSADYTSLAIDSSGNVFVAYSDGTVGGKVTVKTWDSFAWVDVGSKGFSAGAAAFVSLAIGADDTLYVAYRDAANSGKATVQKFNGTSWELVGTAGFSAGSADYISLVVDGPIPMIAFKDGSAGGKVTVMVSPP